MRNVAVSAIIVALAVPADAAQSKISVVAALSSNAARVIIKKCQESWNNNNIEYNKCISLQSTAYIEIRKLNNLIDKKLEDTKNRGNKEQFSILDNYFRSIERKCALKTFTPDPNFVLYLNCRKLEHSYLMQ